jgi:capsular exopolysaccharide synthesis family protein
MQEQYISSRMPTPVQALNHQQENFLVTHADIKRFIKRYSSLLKWSTAIGILLGAAYAGTAVPLYTANAQIIIDPSLPKSLTDTRDNIFGIDSAQVESQIQVIRSESIAQAVVKKLKLAEDPAFSGVSSSIFTLPFRLISGAPELDAAARERLALARFKNGLEVRRVGLSYSIDIYYSAPRPDLAAALANATAEAYIADQINARGLAARQGGLWLEERIDHLRKEMNAAALQAQEFRAKRDYRISPRRDSGTDGPAVASGPSVETHQNTLEELDSTAQTFRRIYESYLSAYTESVQKQSYPISNARVITEATAPTSKSYPRTKLIVLFGGLMGALAGFGIAFCRAQLDRSITGARQVRDELGLECLAMIPSFVDHRPPSPVTRLSAGLALVQRPSDLFYLVQRGAKSIVRRVNDWFMGVASAEGPSKETSHADLLSVVTLPFSIFSHAVKRLRTAIALAARGRQLRSIAVTSTLPGEGKSTIAANLAALFAASGVRTLLIDGDMRRASLSRAFAPDAEQGLQEVLNGECVLKDCIVRVEGTDFDLLPLCTASLSNSSDAAPPVGHAEPLLAEMQKSYDFIIFELPPLSASLDGLAVSSLVDGTIVVAEWGRTPVPLLSESIHLLRNAGANIAGVVINKIDTSTPDNGDLAGNYFSYSYAPANVERLR